MAVRGYVLDAMSTITPKRLSERLESPDDDVLLLDIRPRKAFEDWHIPGSRHIDGYDELQADPASAIDTLDGLPRDSEIVTVCGKGVVSETATEVLRERGYDAKTLIDGLAGWGRVHRHAELPIGDATLVQIARPGTGCLSYVLVSDGEAAVVDPSQYTDRYLELLDEYGAELAFVLETHAHADHVSGAGDLASTADVPYYLHPADAAADPRTTGIEDGTRLNVGSIDLEAIHTPGHTRGSLTYDIKGAALLTGDTLFLDSVGRPDLEGGDRDAVRQRAATLHESLKRLLDRSAGAFVLPAHSPDTPRPPTTASLEAVRDRNELLGEDRAAFAEAVATDIPEPPAHHERIKQANLGLTELEGAEARSIELGPNQCAAGKPVAEWVPTEPPRSGGSANTPASSRCSSCWWWRPGSPSAPSRRSSCCWARSFSASTRCSSSGRSRPRSASSRHSLAAVINHPHKAGVNDSRIVTHHRHASDSA